MVNSMNAILLALFLIAPSASNGDPREGSPEEKKIVIDGDEVFHFADDEPLFVHLAGRSRGGYLGVRLVGITPELREHYGAPREAGVLVSSVEPDSPAAKAGIRVGDVITEADGERVESPWELSRAVRRKKPGETVRIEISRDRASKQLTVTTEVRKRSEIVIKDVERRTRRHRIRRDLESARPLLERFEGFGGMRDRIDELEKRVQELEKKLPAR